MFLNNLTKGLRAGDPRSPLALIFRAHILNWPIAVSSSRIRPGFNFTAPALTNSC